MTEYREVLERPKFSFDYDEVAAILDYVEHHGCIVTASPRSLGLPDPDDEPFPEIAVSSGADYLITGNAAHFPAELCQGVPVVSPADFLKRGVKQRKGKKGRT